VLRLNGMAVDDLIIEEGGSVELNGMACKSVINNGGMLIIRGTITGNLVRNGGSTEIAEGALISGVRY
jgi:hypothetical protein